MEPWAKRVPIRFHFLAGLLEEWNSGPLPVGTKRVPLYSRSTGRMEPKVSHSVPLYSRSTGIMEPWATTCWNPKVPIGFHFIADPLGTKGFPTFIIIIIITDPYVNLLL